MSGSDGYVTEVEYLDRHYRELNPNFQRFVLAGNGVAPPDLSRAYTYMELGFGRGVSLVVNAAANPRGQFYGIDFMPEHVARAQSLATVAGISNLDVRPTSFADLAGVDYPSFDFISMHGVWSWINADNRAHIRDFIARKLKPNGVVYLSYNALPGWAPIVPLRDFMKAEFDRVPGSVETKVAAAIAYAQKLQAAGAQFFETNPKAKTRLKHMSGMPAAYVAHEYFNAFLTPFHFGDMAREMEPLGLTYSGSALLSANIDAVSIAPAARPLVDATRDLIERETAKDYLVNREFRRDIYVRAPRRFEQAEYNRVMLNTSFVAVATPQGFGHMSLETSTGKFKPKSAVHTGIVAALAAGPKSLAEMATMPGLAGTPPAEIINAAYFLMAMNAIDLAGDTSQRTDAAEACRRLNRVLGDPAQGGFEHGVHASPVTGGGVDVPVLEFLYLHTRGNGGADRAYEILRGRGKTLQREGKALNDAEGRVEMARLFENIAIERAPAMRMLGLID